MVLGLVGGFLSLPSSFLSGSRAHGRFPWTQCLVGWSGGRGLAVLAGGLLRVRAVVVGGGSAGAMWKTDKSSAFVVIFVCYLFVVVFVAVFYFCSFVGGQGHCLTRRFMKRCLAGAEDAWRISIVSSVVLCFVILFFI